MSYIFGVGTLSLLTNNGLDVVSTDLSASASTLTAGANRSVMIDGVTAIWSAAATQLTAIISTGAGATGSGLLYYTYLAAGDTTTATVGVFTAAHPQNTSIGIQTAICPLFKFSFGTAANTVSTIALVSGGSATKTIGKVQNVSFNVSTEQAQMRGGGDVYAVDTQFFNGAAEGSFEMADPTASQFLLLGGQYNSGAGSGTWILSAVSKPEPISLVFQNVTNGVTSTHTFLRAYITTNALSFDRTSYLQPSFNFVAQSNNQGNVYRILQ